MEVHSHSHSHPPGHKKRWNHYAWEFIMLFLAVFCGFLAENMREHMVDHQREKKYMRMLIEDLAQDTLAMHNAIGRADSVVWGADSAVVYLRDFKATGEIPDRIAQFVAFGGMRQSLVTSDRTSSQLKNSGALRLVGNEEVGSRILKYWQKEAITNGSIDRYMIYRNASRELIFKLWVMPIVYVAGTNTNANTIRAMRILDKDPNKWGELTNLMAMCKSITSINILRDVTEQLDIARSLIKLIKKEYHLK